MGKEKSGKKITKNKYIKNQTKNYTNFDNNTQ